MLCRFQSLLIAVTSFLLSGAALVATAQGQNPGIDPNLPPAGQEILTRGPIHEAFAEPVVFDPKASPIVPKTPPAQVEEVPPDQKPEGANVQWISGYWAWDDTRPDYIWISGLWRDIPPGRQWVPGYWHQVSGGYQWVSGAWMSTEANQAQQYLPEPPASLEAGPNTDPTVANASWAPGNWVWQNDRYAWQPGYWVNPQSNWMWVPSHYNYTPNGYLYNSGYWDRPLAQRGQLFAPVYYSQPLYNQTGYSYRPSVGLLATSLLSSLFVRPSYGQYYFGDYYAQNNFSSGIYPSYSYHQSRYGYDPLYSYYSSAYGQSNPNWGNQQRDAYLYRRDHADARPPRTYADQLRVVNNSTSVNNVSTVSNTVNNINNVSTITNNINNINNIAMARPLAQLASNGNNGGSPLRFERVNQAQRDQIAQQSQQLQQFRQERLQREAVASKKVAPADRARPRPADLPRSPIVAAQGLSSAPNPAGAAANHTPPALPHRPQPNLNPQPNRAAQRPDPHPELRHNALGMPSSNPVQPHANPAPPVNRPQPRVETPAPAVKPAMPQPAPAPTVRPVVPQPTPAVRPIPGSPVNRPQPRIERPQPPAPAPKPVAPQPAPKPVAPQPAPKPVAPQPAPKPVAPQPAPKPVAPQAVPQPNAVPAAKPVAPVPVARPSLAPAGPGRFVNQPQPRVEMAKRPAQVAKPAVAPPTASPKP